MKRCPSCNRAYTDDTLRFCLEDGTPLAAEETSTAPTLVTPTAPPATVAFDPHRPTVSQPQGTYAAPAWTPPPLKPKRKVWPWVVGGLAILFVVVCAVVGVVLALANIASTSSDNSRPVASPTASRPTPSPEASPALATVEIAGIHMTHDNGAGEPGDEADTFRPSERILHCVINLSSNQPGTKITFKWIAIDSGDSTDHLLKEMEYVTKGSEARVHADWTRHEDWIAGDWKVDVYLNDRLARSVAFTIE